MQATHSVDLKAIDLSLASSVPFLALFGFSSNYNSSPCTPNPPRVSRSGNKPDLLEINDVENLLACPSSSKCGPIQVSLVRENVYKDKVGLVP